MKELKDYMEPLMEESKKRFKESVEERFKEIDEQVKENAALSFKKAFPNAGKFINLNIMAISLRKAMRCFNELRGLIMQPNYTKQTNESVRMVNLSDYSEKIEEMKQHMESVKSYVIDNETVEGIKNPSEQTMTDLDENLESTDRYVGLDNVTVRSMFKGLKTGTINFQDLAEFEKIFKTLYLELCSCVLAYYNTVIIAIGDKADYEHSNQYLIDYFQQKGIKDGTSNYSLIPATKNIFGELIHKKATGATTSTTDFITRLDFNTEIAKRQAKNKLLQNGQ